MILQDSQKTFTNLQVLEVVKVKVKVVPNMGINKSKSSCCRKFPDNSLEITIIICIFAPYNQHLNSIIMKTRQRLLVTLLMAMLMGVEIMAQEAYVVLSSDYKTLTFYFDNEVSTRQGIIYELDPNKDPGWCRHLRDIRRVVFHPSFADARPKSTAYWFGEINMEGGTTNNNILSIEGIQYLNTSEVTCMQGMFASFKYMDNINVSDFDTSNVTDMSYMFWDCKNLKVIDLGGWDTSNVVYMDEMFYGCSSLSTVYVSNGWKTNNVDQSQAMFSFCTNLIGGQGTTYDKNHTGSEYAHIDGGLSNPGYMTNASSIIYGLKVAGESVTGANRKDILSNGVFSYSPTCNTLTVKGDYYNNNDNSIIRSYIDGLIIDVVQDATLTEYKYSSGCPIWLDAPATIRGSAELILKGPQNNAGLYLFNGASVTIDHMKSMTVEGMWGISGPWEQHYNNEKLIVKSSNINITTPEDNNNSAAICDLSGGIELYGCSITAPPGAYINRYGVRYMGELVKSATITADEGVSTCIDNGQIDSVKGQSEEWFTIDGQKLNGKPTKKGVYIRNGKAVVN